MKNKPSNVDNYFDTINGVGEERMPVSEFSIKVKGDFFNFSIQIRYRRKVRVEVLETQE